MAMYQARHDALVALRAAEIALVDASLAPLRPVHIFSSFMWTRLNQVGALRGLSAATFGHLTARCRRLQDAHGIGNRYTYAHVSRWTAGYPHRSPPVPAIDLFACSLVLLPVNYVNFHWALGAIFPQTCEIATPDSIGPGADRVFEILLRYLQDEHMEKKGAPLPGVWRRRAGPWSQQVNAYDCGICAIRACYRLLCELPIDYRQDGNAAFRRSFLLQCLNGMHEDTVVALAAARALRPGGGAAAAAAAAPARVAPLPRAAPAPQPLVAAPAPSARAAAAAAPARVAPLPRAAPAPQPLVAAPVPAARAATAAPLPAPVAPLPHTAPAPQPLVAAPVPAARAAAAAPSPAPVAPQQRAAPAPPAQAAAAAPAAPDRAPVSGTLPRRAGRLPAPLAAPPPEPSATLHVSPVASAQAATAPLRRSSPTAAPAAARIDADPSRLLPQQQQQQPILLPRVFKGRSLRAVRRARAAEESARAAAVLQRGAPGAAAAAPRVDIPPSRAAALPPLPPAGRRRARRKRWGRHEAARRTDAAAAASAAGSAPAAAPPWWLNRVRGLKYDPIERRFVDRDKNSARCMIDVFVWAFMRGPGDAERPPYLERRPGRLVPLPVFVLRAPALRAPRVAGAAVASAPPPSSTL